MRFSVGALVLLLVAALAPDVQAQGLIWNLPEDGTSIVFEGTYTQQNFRPETGTAGDEIVWDKIVTMKSVGKETAEFNGKPTECRWIEIKVVVGKKTEKGLDPGPMGSTYFKVLVPENQVVKQVNNDGQLIDEESIFAAYLPIVKGWTKTGGNVLKADGSTVPLTKTSPIEASVLQVYPMISLMMHYKTMVVSTETIDPGVPAGPVNAYQVTGRRTVESRSIRTTSVGTLYRSDDVEKAPFGLVAWRVELTRESKDVSQSRDEFKVASKVIEDLKAVRVEQNAESELQTPANANP